MARAPKLSADTVKREIQADNEARKAKAAAKRAEKREAEKAAKQALADKIEAGRVDSRAEKIAQEAKTAIQTQFADFKAVHSIAEATQLEDLPGEVVMAFNTFLWEAGYNADGTVANSEDEMPPVAKLVKRREATYTGPMLVLREAAKHYVTAPNGNPNCGDELATLLGTMKREDVVTQVGAFLVAQKVLENANPYKHLNPGQQSMNLRNKLRGAIRANTVTIAQFKTFLKA